MTRTKRVTVLSQEQYESGPFVFHGLLKDMIAALNQILESIPEQFRDTTTCEISSIPNYDSHYASIEVEYTRPTTPDEDAEAAKLQKQRELMIEQQQRVQYEALKAKFGS